MTPDEHPSPAPRGDALDHVMTNLFDSELERIAFARADTDADRERASAAVREMARRASDHARRSGDAAAPEVAPHDRARGADARPASSAPVPPARAWAARGRALVAPVAVIVVAVAAIATVAGLATTPSPGADSGPSSLEVFTSEPSTDDLALRAQLEREGLRLSVAPRIVAARGEARIIAYRFVTTAPAERPRNQVCLLLDDEHALGSPVCTERDEFLRDGMLASLAGASGTFVVQWGPTGAAELSVLRQNQVALAIPRAPAAELFLAAEPGVDDVAYESLLRTLHPDDRLIVRVLATTASWDAVGALVASADTGRWSYCVHLFERGQDAREQVGASVTCAGLDPFERAGLIAQARSATSTLTLEWLPDGVVTVDERDAP